jgi:hypothetical protein
MANANDLELRPANNVGWKVAAFLAALVLAFAGTINGVIAVTAYLGGGLADAVGTGADKVLADTNVTPTDPDAAVRRANMESVSSDAHDLGTRAKAVGIAIGVLAAVELLAGALVRKRYASRIIPTVLGLVIAGEIAMMVLMAPSALGAIGIVGALFGLLIWAKGTHRQPQQVMSMWGPREEAL